MSPQHPENVINEIPQGVNTIFLPASKGELLAWAGSKGAIASVAVLNDPKSILLRPDQGQPLRRPPWA